MFGLNWTNVDNFHPVEVVGRVKIAKNDTR